LLIDRSHRWWIVAFVAGSLTALGLYGHLSGKQPGGLTGGSAAGMRFGVAGAALMLFALGLAGLRHVPKWWWVGPRQTWLRGHIWLGSLSLVLILCHSGFRWGGPLERVLWIAFLLTLATGYLGLLLQRSLPRRMTARVPCEVPYEQIPELCRKLRRGADLLAESFLQNEALSAGSRTQLAVFYEQLIRPFLAGRAPPGSDLIDRVKAQALFATVGALPTVAATESAVKQFHAALAELEALCGERRLLAEQERLHRWLHLWLYVHVPVSVALLVLGVAHVVLASYY
jgi:hypothetical protein